MNNRSLHRLARRCISQLPEDKLSFGACAALERILEYRTSLMDNAEQWLRVINVEFGYLSHEWNQLIWQQQLKSTDRRVLDRYNKIAPIVNQAELGPNPADGHGEPWYKHNFFFAAALASTHLDEKEVDEKIQIVEACKFIFLTPFYLFILNQTPCRRKRTGPYSRKGSERDPMDL